MPAMPLKTKVNSQGEILSAGRIDSMRTAQKTPEAVKGVDIHSTKTTPDNRVDSSRQHPSRTSQTASTTSGFPKTETSVNKKKKQESIPPVSPRSSKHLKKPLTDPKVESKKETNRPVPVATLTPNKQSTDVRKKDGTIKLALESTRVSLTTDKLAGQNRKGSQSICGSGSSVSNSQCPSEDTFPNLQKFVSEVNFLRDGIFPEESFRHLPHPPSTDQGLTCSPPNEKENSFCEITSRQDVSLGNLHTDFIDSFRAVNPSSPVSNASQHLISGLNGTQISFEKKAHGNNILLEEPGESLLHSLDKLDVLQKENSKALANFFLLGSEFIRDPEDEQIEVILNKKMDRKQSSRQWKDDFWVESSPSGVLTTDNPFYKNDLENMDTFSLKKRSPSSSMETPKRPSDAADPRHFDTFRNQTVLEVTSVNIFRNSRQRPSPKTLVNTFNFTQGKSTHIGGGHFEDLILSSKLNSGKDSRSQREGDTLVNTSLQSLPHPDSTSSLDLMCHKCRTLLLKTSTKALAGKPSEEVMDSNQSSSRYLLSSVSGIKRNKFLQMSNDEVHLSPTINGISQSSFSKTNSDGVGYVSSPQQSSKGGIGESSLSRVSCKQSPSDLTQSGFNTSSDPPLKVLVSIFKKIVVFNTKWERVKESLFLLSPDIVTRALHSLGTDTTGKVSWSTLADFLNKRKIPIQKQQLARLIFYVQSFVASRNGQLSAVSNYTFFNFLLTPKFMYSSGDESPPSPLPSPAKPAEFSKEEVTLLGEILQIVAHKIDYFAMSFKSLQPEFVQQMFGCLSRGGPVVSREDIVAAITAKEAQIKVQDVCFVLDEFQSNTCGIHWTRFSEYFDKKIWRL